MKQTIKYPGPAISSLRFYLDELLRVYHSIDETDFSASRLRLRHEIEATIDKLLSKEAPKPDEPF